MARKKISEFTAKKILSSDLALPYRGMSFSADDDPSRLQKLSTDTTYVVKVDEGIKKRMKKGLVALNKKPHELHEAIKKLEEKGYKHFIIEPFVPHEQTAEKYISIERMREGLRVLYSPKGGIDIEENQDSLKKIVFPYSVIPVETGIQESHKMDSRFRGNDEEKEITKVLSLDPIIFHKLLIAFDKNHFSFLEINPLVVTNDKIYFLDVAAEVDSAGEFFVNGAWNENDLRSGDIKKKTAEENAIDVLSQKSQASFTLNFLNPDGSLFVLLSGGGASIVMADEVYNLGYGRELSNYGEYSGNPNAQETYLYTKNILSLLLKSKAKKKVLIIGGGVANFTDVRITFKGLIAALQEVIKELQKQKIKVFVRRGGPHQVEGLAMMEEFLQKNNLAEVVTDQTTPLPEIVAKAVAEL